MAPIQKIDGNDIIINEIQDKLKTVNKNMENSFIYQQKQI